MRKQLLFLLVSKFFSNLQTPVFKRLQNSLPGSSVIKSALLSVGAGQKQIKIGSSSLQTRLYSYYLGMKDEEAAAKAGVSEDGQPNIFGKILKGEIPCNKVYEDDMCLAFHDVNPQAPVHIILIPKDTRGRLTRLSNATEADEDILGHLMAMVAKIVKQEKIGDFRVVVNDGPKGCQSVYHLHIHILGGRQMHWPPG